MVIELSKKFLEVMTSEQFVEDPEVRQTCLYGLGSFGYHVPKGQYGDLLAPTVLVMKATIMEADAFGEDKLVATENAMAGVARLCYK